MTKRAETTETHSCSRSSVGASRAWVGRAAGLLAAALLAPAVTGCVETGLYEKAALDLDGARRENLQKDQQIRALQWQLAAAGQQIQSVAQQNAAALTEAERHAQESSAANRLLAERLTARDQEAARLTAAVARAEDDASSCTKQGAPGPTVRLRPEDLKRIEAAAGARDAELTKLLARVEKILADRAARGTRPGERPPRILEGDLVDPWDGERK